MRERRLAATDDDSTAEYRDLHDHVSWAGLGVRERWVAATDDDGWTLRSATGCLTAHSEHTIAITEDGAEVLTLPR